MIPLLTVLAALLMLAGAAAMWSGMTSEQRRFRSFGGPRRPRQTAGLWLLLAGLAVGVVAFVLRFL